MRLKPRPFRKIRKGRHWSTTGLVSFWPMYEGDGDEILDLSGNGFRMDFVNSPVWSYGKFGPSILLDDGSSQHLVYNSPILIIVPMTLACWFNSDSVTLGQTLIAITANDNNFFRLIAG